MRKILRKKKFKKRVAASKVPWIDKAMTKFHQKWKRDLEQQWAREHDNYFKRIVVLGEHQP